MIPMLTSKSSYLNISKDFGVSKCELQHFEMTINNIFKNLLLSQVFKPQKLMFLMFKDFYSQNELTTISFSHK